MNTTMLATTAVLAIIVASPASAQTASQHRQQHSVDPSYDVYKGGRYLGSDPDPTIRALIQRGNGAAGQW